MTGADFRDRLATLGLSQSAFAREIERLSGERMPLRTVQAWALGESPTPAPVAALLTLLDRL